MKGRPSLARAAAALAAGWALFAALGTLVLSRRIAGGFDFYYYLCYARDLAVYGDAPPDRHVYFPGVFRFWSLVMRLGHGTLAELQWVCVLTLGLVAVLAGALAGVLSRSALAGALAAVWLLSFAGLADGLEGCTEPIATIPLLLALLVWRGEPLRERAGLRRALALGAGCGLAVYTKQQAGLLAVGALALLPGLARAGPDAPRRHSPALVALVPAVAALVLLGGVLAEGMGLQPLRQGLAFAAEYESTAGFWVHFKYVLGLSPVVAAVLLLGLAALGRWLLHAARPSSRAEAAADPLRAVAGFAAIAAAASLLQLTRRAYGHYLLLTAPFAVVAVFLEGRHLGRTVARPALARGIALALSFALLLLVNEPWAVRVDSWPRAAVPPPFAERWLDEPGVADDVAKAGALLPPGTSALVLPPTRNELHFVLGTRPKASPTTYRPGIRTAADQHPVAILDAARWPEVEAVIVVPSERGNAQGFWRGQRLAETQRALAARDFEPALALRTMTIWKPKGARR